MKYAILVAGLSAVSLVACGGGDEDSASDTAETTPAAATSGDRAIITVEGGVFDGVTEVAVANCDLESPRINIATVQDVDGSNSLFAMSDPQDDGTATFQMVQSSAVFFDDSTPISYTIDGNRLTGSGGEMDGDPGKVSVEVICE